MPDFQPWRETELGPIQIATIPSDGAFDMWWKLRGQYEVTSQLPVVLGDPSELPIIEEVFATRRPIEEVVRASMEVDVDAWLAGRAKEFVDEEYENEFDVPEVAVAPLGEPSFATLGRGGPVVIALVPCRAPEECFATLPFGDWNGCPPDPEHIALLRRWKKQFGIEIVARTQDVLELYVRRPLSDLDEAREVARTHLLYCPDIREYCGYSADILAQRLLGVKSWYFWWD